MTFSPGSGRASGKPATPRVTKRREGNQEDIEVLLNRKTKDQMK